MNAVKTLEQIEFADLFDRLKRQGVRAADVARELKMSSAAISMLLNGERSPRPLTLDAMRNYVGRVCGSDGMELKEKTTPYSEIAAQLAALPEHERKEVLDVFNVLVKQAEQRVHYTKQPKSPKPGAGGG